MEDSAKKNKSTTSFDAEKHREDIRRERANRNSVNSEKKAGKTSYRDHKNPIIRALSRTGYTVWIIGMAIALILAFIVSVALL